MTMEKGLLCFTYARKTGWNEGTGMDCKLEDKLFKRIARWSEKGRRGSLLDALAEESGMERDQALAALGEHFGMETVNLALYPVDLEAAAMLPKETALQNTAVAFCFQEGRLHVAIGDPLDFQAANEVKMAVEPLVKLYLADPAEILDTIEACYSENDAKRTVFQMQQELPKKSGPDEAAKETADAQAPVVKLLNNLLLKGYSTNASDIHIEPFEKDTAVRMRVDGMLVHYVTLPKQAHGALIARIKIMSGLDIANKRMPQDGHCKTLLDDVELNLRVSVIPTVHGEKAVIRFLTSAVTIDNEKHFGMDEENAKKFENMLLHPHGIIYLTGPTGSGKTTTLYLALQRLAENPVNISTIEDPVEKNLDGINQMQVNPAAGVTFESGLRALLRQDPDILMVGETRDNETARISARAALTGHLVFSTLHTNDAVSSIVRLRDMGLEDYLIANGVIGVVAQRLVKKLCPACCEEYEADEEELRMLGLSQAKLKRARGCHLCGNTGYRGRIAVHEILLVDGEIRKMIVERAPVEAIYRHAVTRQNMKRLKESMRDLVLSGVSGMEDYQRIAYELEFL